jgi:hypothetical protein
MTPEERQKRMEERMASMTPEERAQFQERMRQRQAEGGGRGGFGGDQGAGGGGRGGPGQGASGDRGNRQGQSAGNAPAQGTREGGSRRGQLVGQQAANNKSAAVTSATTIDALFAPLPVVETRGRAWLYINKNLKPVELRLGISDGTFTEVLNADAMQPGQEVVTAVVTPEMASRPANQQNNNANNPLMPQRGRGPGGPGGGGGGGRGGGRG